jgi:hypothetical protein
LSDEPTPERPIGHLCKGHDATALPEDGESATRSSLRI